MKNLIVALSLLISSLSFSQEAQEIYQRAKISYSIPEDLIRLQSLGIPVDHGIKKKGHFIISEFSVSELDLVRENGYQVEVIIPDAKAHFFAENAKGGGIRQRNADCNDPVTVYET
ncbi:MAG: hypothetical protein AAF466_11545, partial [Bacteroidota bacterium]